jgi:hypothetical protein
MTDSEILPKTIISVQDMQRVTKYLRAVSTGYEGVVAYWKSNPPDRSKQPVTSALVDAYVIRLEIKSLASSRGLQSFVAANDKYPSMHAELRELGDWLETVEPSYLNPKVTEDTEDRFGDALVADLDFSYSEARALLRKQSQPQKGAPNKHPLTLAMFDARVANGWSYMELASKMCDCSLRNHNDLCRERIRKRLKELESVLSKFGIEYRKKRRN